MCADNRKVSGPFLTYNVCLPLSNDKLLLTIFLLFVRYFPSYISNTSIVSINFRANLNVQNAGNGIFGLHNFLGEYVPTRVAFGHFYPSLISNDNWSIFLNLFQVQV